jgi:oligopeptide/dipeptide ABC transporter ATP-binding protein
MGSVLNIQKLRVAFPKLSNQIEVVRGCSLEVNSGEIVGLVGESGSGKSMTALSCLGLVPKPGKTSGHININGQEVLDLPDSKLCRLRGGTAAMIFQNPMTALNPFIRIGDQLCDAIRFSLSISHRASADEALGALESVHIPNPSETLKKYPHQLSGGQLQRIMIAMAIACKPDLLIADEPTTALDVTIQAQILLLIRELTVKNDLAVLFITHDLAVVASLCDRVSVMYAGEIVESGEVDDVFSHPAHPYTRKLLHTVPTIGHKDRPLEFIAGQMPDMAALPMGCAFQARCSDAIEFCQKRSPLMSSVSATHRVACHLNATEGGADQ